jgi:hypothetical protein
VSNGQQCGPASARYTLPYARFLLLTHAEIGAGTFLRYLTRTDREAAGWHVCEWRKTFLGVHPNETRVATRKWADNGRKDPSGRSQKTYWQTAVIFPDYTTAHEGITKLQSACARKSKDSKRTIHGWLLLRRVQEIPCIAGLGRCRKAIDVLSSGNLVIITGYANVYQEKTGNIRDTVKAADRLTIKILDKTQERHP